MPKTSSSLALAQKKIVSFIRRKVEDAHADGSVVGISGGIDSAVTAFLCVEALGRERVLGLIMPDMRVTPKEDASDAKLVARRLGIETRLIDIAAIHSGFMKKLEANRLAEGNLRARIRMSLLYYHANLLNRLVVGTGDKSELLLGYFTKFGDGGVDILPIGDLYKTDVRRLGVMLGVSRRIVNKKSSPRLWAGQLAEDEIGLSYDLVDLVFKLRFGEGLDFKRVASHAKVSGRGLERIFSKYSTSEHKRRPPDICELP